MTSAMPNWAETTVRYLRKNYPLLTPASSKKPFPELLTSALEKASYLRAEMIDERKFSRAAWVNALASSVASWTKPKHDALAKFLEAGGYATLKKPASSLGAYVVESDDGAEVIEIEMDGDKLDDDLIDRAIDALRKPPEQISPKHELEEIVADASRAADPRFGVW